MAGTRKLVIEVLGDAKGLGQTFDDTEKKAAGFGKKAGLALAGIAGAAGLAGAVMFDAFKDAAADESEQKIFEKQLLLAGGSQKVIDGFNKQIDAGMKLKGFTDTDLRTAYAQAYSQSKDVATAQDDVALAMDLARKAGVPLSAALDAVTKAHNGNTKALKTLVPEFGDMITGATDSEDALHKVRDASAGLADEFANSTQGKMERVKIQFGEMKESLGAALIPAFNALLPVITSVTAWLGENLPIAVEKVRVWFQENWPKIRDAVVPVLEGIRDFIVGFIDFVQGVWDMFGATIVQFAKDHFEAVVTTIKGVFEVLDGVFQFFKDLFTGKWSELWDDILGVITGIKDIILGAVEGIWAEIKLVAKLAWDAVKGIVTGAWDAIVDFTLAIPGRIAGVISTMWDGIKTGITAAKDWVGDRIDDVVGFATGLPKRMAGIFAGMWDGIKNAFKSALNTIIGWWNGIEFTMPSQHIWGVGDIGGWTIGLPDIPKFHSGGTVNFGPAGEGLALLRNGETVLTPEQGSMRGGVIVNVYGSVIRERDLVRAVADGIVDGQRRGEITAGFLVSP